MASQKFLLGANLNLRGGGVREHYRKKKFDPVLSKVVIVIGFNLGIKFVWTTGIQNSHITYNKLLGSRSVDLGFSEVK